MATPSLVLLFGGGFQDALGEVIAKGTLRLKLSQDEVLSNNAGQLCGGAEVTIPLDANGNVDTAQANVSVWPTDQMSPAGAFYTVWAYAADGQLAWGPNSNLTVPSGSNYNLDGWVPNLYANNLILQVGSVLLETNGAPNSDQNVYNAIAGTNMTITAGAGGAVTFEAASGTGLATIALTVPTSLLSVAGSPVTPPNGTFAVTLTTQNANTVLVGPVSGGAATPTFRLLQTADVPGANVNSQTSNYTLALSDANNIVTVNATAAVLITVPATASVNFLVGTTITVMQMGAGQVSFTPAANVTINTPSSWNARTLFSTIAIVEVAENVWVAGGDLQ
jgi:hypothetical protein